MTATAYDDRLAERVDGTRPTVCEEADPDLMFPSSEDPILYGRPNLALEAAKEACSGCWFRVQCLEGALDRREQHGVWGGLTTREREALRRRRYPRRDNNRTQAETLFDHEEAMSA